MDCRWTNQYTNCLIRHLFGPDYCFFNIIPYIGIFTPLLISSAITLGTAPDQVTVIYVMITLVMTHLVDSNNPTDVTLSWKKHYKRLLRLSVDSQGTFFMLFNNSVVKKTKSDQYP